MIHDRLVEVRGMPVMEEEDALAQSPQRGCAELAATGIALRDAVGQPSAHVVDGEVAEGEKFDIVLVRIARSAGGLLHDVAKMTPDVLEHLSASGGGGRVRYRRGWSQEPHEGG